MQAKNFTNTHLPLLNRNDTVKMAITAMKKYRLNQLCAIIDRSFGIFRLARLVTLDKNTKLGALSDHFEKVNISSEDHIWECIHTLQSYNTEVLPIVDRHNDFVGSVTTIDIFKRLIELFPIANGGAILQLEMTYRNYSLVEIASIVENTNAKITLLSVTPMRDSEHINVTFSIDKTDASEVMQSFERHNYVIDAWFMDKGKLDHLIDERYSAFMQYLNV